MPLLLHVPYPLKIILKIKDLLLGFPVRLVILVVILLRGCLALRALLGDLLRLVIIVGIFLRVGFLCVFLARVTLVDLLLLVLFLFLSVVMLVALDLFAIFASWDVLVQFLSNAAYSSAALGGRSRDLPEEVVLLVVLVGLGVLVVLEVPGVVLVVLDLVLVVLDLVLVVLGVVRVVLDVVLRRVRPFEVGESFAGLESAFQGTFISGVISSDVEMVCGTLGMVGADIL